MLVPMRTRQGGVQRLSAKSDAVYIYIASEIGVGGVSKTYACDPSAVDGQIHLDFDDRGRLLGIEILDAL